MNDINALQGQKHYHNNESVTLLPLQGVGIHSIITQGVALGYELFGPSARFNRTGRFIFSPSQSFVPNSLHIIKKSITFVLDCA